MDDGTWHGSGVRIATNSFELAELKLLQLALANNFNLKTSLHKNNNNHHIYIKKESMKLLISLVLPHFHSSMYYKLGL